MCWGGGCYWFLSGEVGSTSADTIGGSVALFMLMSCTSSSQGNKMYEGWGLKKMESLPQQK